MTDLIEELEDDICMTKQAIEDLQMTLSEQETELRYYKEIQDE